MSPGNLLWISEGDVRAAGLSAPDCIAAIRDVLKWHAQGLVEVPVKVGIHPAGARHIHAMPALIPPLDAAGLKWIADFPANSKRALPTLSALIVLNDTQTGAPVCVMEGASITAMRTAAMTAVALQACATKNARIATIVGTGAQARDHVLTLPQALAGLAEIRVVGRSAEASERFCTEERRSEAQTKLRPFADRAAAVSGADVVVTVTNDVNTRLLEPEWLAPGATVVVLDNGGKETTITRAIDRVIVDDARAFATPEAQSRFPAGVPNIDAEIGSVLLGRAAGRTNDRERVLILNLGIGACDIAIAVGVYRRARFKSLGTPLVLSDACARRPAPESRPLP